MRLSLTLTSLAIGLVAVAASTLRAADAPVDFNREVRPILASNCFICHGPDEKERKAKLRLDTREGALHDNDGVRAVVPGKPDDSELIKRIITTEKDDLMPPAKSGKKLSEKDIATLKRWVAQGAPYAQHWSYVKPVKAPLPDAAAALRDAKGLTPAERDALKSWPKNGVDHFILARLLREGMKPSPEADRYALIRRVSLDITGLPPTIAEVDAFVNDKDPLAYEKLVDKLLARETYGEHWARMWLDLARYADSSGYADDPARTIWAYRDWVIKSFNSNKPFDQFTIEQLAGDMLPNPTQDQLIATAFHRNTQTNNEGGTNDEEYRNVAIVDRVNTTFAVWMGTTMACAQCHTHKYDPITQQEYFEFYAILNNTEDADRGDESPTLPIEGEDMKGRKGALAAQIAELDKKLSTPTPALLAAQAEWEQSFPRDLKWRGPKPSAVTATSKAAAKVQDDGVVIVPSAANTDSYTIELSPDLKRLTALRLEALPHDSLPKKGPGHAANGDFIVTHIKATIVPPDQKQTSGRFVRIELPGAGKFLHMAEVQVFSGGNNVALKGAASQSSTDYDGPANLAIDGKTSGVFADKSVTHTAMQDNPWWEVDLKSSLPIDRIVVWNRTENVETRIEGFKVHVFNEKREVVWTSAPQKAPAKDVALVPGGGPMPVEFSLALADSTEKGFNAASVIDGKGKGWSPAAGKGAAGAGKAASLTLVAKQPVPVAAGSKLVVVIDQQSAKPKATLGAFRVSATESDGVATWTATPPEIATLLAQAPQERDDAEKQTLTQHYVRNIAPQLAADRKQLEALRGQLAGIKPVTVPIYRELPAGRRRVTKFQYRGNFLDTGPEVKEGLPTAFHQAPKDAPMNRLTAARWLVDENNPLTARVIVNRYWEKIFGTGIVATSEEFGSQGDLPWHPELLDWLAVEFATQRQPGGADVLASSPHAAWDMKALVRMLVTSAAYRQSSKVDDALLVKDPENRFLARGPRFRITAESIRDQALFVAGQLSAKMYGPPVKPPQPQLGVSAAFGGGIDWNTSEGEDKYRRGLYTTWRRSNPYPSMATFDAPNREVCTIRRDRTNTPLQSLVTMNDPVYVEASQALGRRIVKEGGSSLEDRIRYGFRLCLARPPEPAEMKRLLDLHKKATERYAKDKALAERMATKPIGPVPAGGDVVDLAAWTLVSNVMLNLDEMFMSR